MIEQSKSFLAIVDELVAISGQYPVVIENEHAVFSSGVGVSISDHFMIVYCGCQRFKIDLSAVDSLEKIAKLMRV